MYKTRTWKEITAAYEALEAKERGVNEITNVVYLFVFIACMALLVFRLTH